MSRLCRSCFHLVTPGEEWVLCTSETCSRVRDLDGRIGPRLMDPRRERSLSAGWLRRRQGPDLAAPCPYCELRESLVPACPRCGAELTGAGLADDAIIAVLGATDAGKTHYLATLYHLLAEAPEPVGGDVWELEIDEATREALREELWRPLFEERRELDKTPATHRLPFEVVLHHRPSGRRVLLAFEDLAGEVLGDPERLAREEFLHHARGVVLLADPLAFDPDSPYPTATEILASYRRVLERPGRRRPDPAAADVLPLAPEQKILAVAVTKADLVLDDRNDPFWREPSGETGEDESSAAAGPEPGAPGYWDARAAESERVRDWLVERSGRAARDLVRHAAEFADASYFFVSSYGYEHPPHTERLPEAPRPRRVAEPLFALLDRFAQATVPAPAGRPPAPAADRRGRRGTAGRAPRREEPEVVDDDVFLPEEL